MAVIKPFKGVIYNSKLIEELGKVITPPYDVIDAAGQDKLHAACPYNVIRLEYGKTSPEDTERDNRYTRAEAVLNQWFKDQILVIDEPAAFYLYEQHYTYNRNSYRRRGIFTALKVDHYQNKTVLPHELTMSAPKADRLELLKRLQTNISPIFTLYPDPEDRIAAYFAQATREKPLFEAEEETGQVHKVWKLTDLKIQQDLSHYLHDQPFLIADGHHRYETALKYSATSASRTGDGKDYIMTVMVSMKDPGLLILPTHRLITGLDSNQEIQLQKLLEKYFSYEKFGDPGRMDCNRYLDRLAELNRTNGAIGIIDADQAGFISLDLSGDSEALPVEILQDQILKPLLAPGEQSIVDQKMLSYPHDIDSAMQAVLSGQARVAFILEPIAVEAVLKRAEAGRVMPQKSTFFYPKLPSGLVMHHHRLSY